MRKDGRIGVSVAGASARSTFLFEYLRSHPEEGFVTGVYDIVPERCSILLDHYGIGAEAVVYPSLADAVSDPGADAVFVMTTDAAHPECAVAALEAGKSVYCEKPMAVTMQGAKAIASAAEKARGLFYLGMNLRHSPVHEALHNIVASGKLGKVITIEANEHYYGGKTYFRRWNRLRKHGGGLWLTKACHDFDILTWLAGGRPLRIMASCGLDHYRPRPDAPLYCRECGMAKTCPDYCPPPDGDSLGDRLARATERATGVKRDMCLWNSDKDTFDNGMAIVEYDNGSRACYTVNVMSAHTTRMLVVTGSGGMARADLYDGTVEYWKRHAPEDSCEKMDASALMRGGHGGADERILADFFRCVRTGSPPRSSWQDGLTSVALGIAATKSSDTGRIVSVRM